MPLSPDLDCVSPVIFVHVRKMQNAFEHVVSLKCCDFISRRTNLRQERRKKCKIAARDFLCPVVSIFVCEREKDNRMGQKDERYYASQTITPSVSCSITYGVLLGWRPFLHQVFYRTRETKSLECRACRVGGEISFYPHLQCVA